MRRPAGPGALLAVASALAGCRGGGGQAADAAPEPDAAPPAPTVRTTTPTPGPARLAQFAIVAQPGTRIQAFAQDACAGPPVLDDASSTSGAVSVEVPVDVAATVRVSARVQATDGAWSECSAAARYVHDEGRFQRMTFHDEFRGPQPGDDPSCFAMPAQCVGEYQTGVHACAGDLTGLAALDRCAWTVLDQNNWMAMGSTPSANGYNAFVPEEVAVRPDVDDGVLVLSGRGHAPDGQALDPSVQDPDLAALFAQPTATWLASYDCRWSTNSTRCPFRSGAVYSKRLPAAGATSGAPTRGFTQAYGRWEIRAKLPHGPGSFPAQWLLPQTGAWPEAGEIDIMEAGRAADVAYQTFHTGYCDRGAAPYEPSPAACRAAGGQRLKLSKGSLLRARAAATLTDAYHVYAVDWSPAGLRMTVDDVITLDLPAGQLTYSSFSDHGLRWRGAARPVSIPDTAFFLILNHTIHDDGQTLTPYGFTPQAHVIDYVRVYTPCATPAEFCPAGMEFDGEDGMCHAPDGSAPPAPSACVARPTARDATTLDPLAFSACTDPCPLGGWYSGVSCEFMTVPAGNAWFYTTGDGVERMYWTDPSSTCTAPIDGASAPLVQVGDFDGANCHLDPTRPGLTYGSYGAGFHYQPACDQN